MISGVPADLYVFYVYDKQLRQTEKINNSNRS